MFKPVFIIRTSAVHLSMTTNILVSCGSPIVLCATLQDCLAALHDVDLPQWYCRPTFIDRKTLEYTNGSIFVLKMSSVFFRRLDFITEASTINTN